MKTLTKAQVFQHMADNVRASKSPVDGLRVGDGSAWVPMSEQAHIYGIISGNFDFALAPRTHTLNGYEVPAPETEAPEARAEYWYLSAFKPDGVRCATWMDKPHAHNALKNGLWLSEEDAIANAKAIRGEDPYKEAE